MWKAKETFFELQAKAKEACLPYAEGQVCLLATCPSIGLGHRSASLLPAPPAVTVGLLLPALLQVCLLATCSLSRGESIVSFVFNVIPMYEYMQYYTLATHTHRTTHKGFRQGYRRDISSKPIEY